MAILGTLLFLYVTFSVVFNHTIQCYERYICPVFSGLSIFVIYLIISVDIREKRKNLYYFLISLLIMLFLLNFPKLTTFEYQPEFETLSNQYASIIERNIPTGERPAKVLTVYNECDSYSYTCVLWQHHLYFSLLDDDILVIGTYLADETKIPPEFYIDIKNHKVGDSMKGYDYVFIVEDIGNVNKDCQQYFGKTMRTGDLYKINENSNGIINLKKVLN